MRSLSSEIRATSSAHTGMIDPGDADPLAAAHRETAEVIPARMRELLDPYRWRQENEKGIAVPFYDVAGVTVWGATARILDQFREVWRSLRTSPPRSA